MRIKAYGCILFNVIIFLRHDTLDDDNDGDYDDKVGTLNLSNLPVILLYVHQFNN